MRVYFAPCGIGLGHVGRCIPIARKLLEKEAEVTFSTYREGIDYVEREKLPLTEAPPIGFQVKLDGTIDFKQTLANPGPLVSSFKFLKQVNAEIQTIGSFNPDVVVSDSRISPLLAAKLLRKPKVCILNQFQVIIPRRKRFLHFARLADNGTLTLIGKLWTSDNTVLIPDFPQPYTISAGNLNIPRAYRKNVRLIGPIIPRRSDEFESKEQLRRKLGLPLDKPVIFVPISGPIMERAFLTQILQSILIEFPDTYEIVVSLGYPNVDAPPARYGKVTVYKWIPNRFEYLKACDLVISRAGHGTITQCMCYGKPMILIPTPSHTEQLGNAAQAMKIGVAKAVQQEEINRKRLQKKVEDILESDIPERVEEIQREVLKSDGLKNAAEIITKVAKKQTSILG